MTYLAGSDRMVDLNVYFKVRVLDYALPPAPWRKNQVLLTIVMNWFGRSDYKRLDSPLQLSVAATPNRIYRHSKSVATSSQRVTANVTR